MNPNATDDQRRPSRGLPGLTSISHSIQKSVTTITEPLSPSPSEFDLEARPNKSGFSGRLRAWSHHFKNSDVRSDTSSDQPDTKEPRTLMTLPHELQILVLSFLEFGDIVCLRRTAKYWYNFATPQLIRTIYGPDNFRAMLVKHCRVCLTYCPEDVTRIYTTRFDAGYPLSSRCVPCTVQSNDGTVLVGRKVTLGNSTDYWPCQWCGWPITDDPSRGTVIHSNCNCDYSMVVAAFVCLGCVQFLIGTVAAGLLWHYFPSDKIVLAPTIVGFVLTWVCILFIMVRENRVRTYHWALFLELAILGLWVSTKILSYNTPVFFRGLTY